MENIVRKLEELYYCLAQYNLQNKLIGIADGDGVHLVMISDIIYCETLVTKRSAKPAMNGFAFYLIDGRKIISTDLMPDNYEKTLSAFLFVKTSSQYLVNLKYVSIYNRRKARITLVYHTPATARAFTHCFFISEDYRAHMASLYNSITTSLIIPPAKAK